MLSPLDALANTRRGHFLPGFRYMFGGQRYVSKWDLLHNRSNDWPPHGPRLAYASCFPNRPEQQSCSVDPAGNS